MRKLAFFLVVIITQNKNNQRDRRSRFWNNWATDGGALKSDKMLVGT
jgi:hypothetical protein